MVVLGASAKTIEMGIHHYGVNILVNPNWTEGMASSINWGLNSFKDKTGIDNVVIMLCDQPLVSSFIIDKFIDKHQETNKKIIACEYNKTIGVPALFDRSVFPELMLLKGQEGAKKILAKYPDDVATIPFETGSVDIDTISDYQALLNRFK